MVKMKLLTICVLALLLCTLFPATAMAAPVKTTARESVYVYESVNIFGPRAGKMTFDTSSGAFSCACNSQLEPSTSYRMYLAYDVSGTTYLYQLFSASTDAHGHLSATGTFSSTELSEINAHLANGGFVLRAVV